MSTETTVTHGNNTLFRYTCDVASQDSINNGAAGAVAAAFSGNSDPFAVTNPYNVSMKILKDVQARSNEYMTEAVAVYNKGGQQQQQQNASARRNRPEGGEDDSDDSD